MNLEDVTAVDIGKGSVTPFHRHLRLRLNDGNVIDVLASDRGPSTRSQLKRLAQQIEAEANASRTQATDP